MAVLGSFNTTLALLGLTSCLLYLLYRCCLCRPIPGIPYNHNAAYTLLGDLPAMVKVVDSDMGVWRWMAQHTVTHNSPVFQMFLRPFSKPWVIIADFRESQDIMTRRTKEFDRSLGISKDIFEGLVPEFHMNLLTSDEKFRAHRDLIKDTMTPSFLHQIAAPNVHTSVSNLIKLWSLKTQIGKQHPFNASDDIFNFMMDSSSAVVFGLDPELGTNASRAQYLSAHMGATIKPDSDGVVELEVPSRSSTHEALLTIMYSLAGAVSSLKPRLYWMYTHMTPTWRKAYRIKEEMMDNEIERGVHRFKRGDRNQKCALDNILQRELMAAEKSGRPPNYNTRVIKDELFGVLAGAYDTTAGTLTWGVKYLQCNPQVQSKLRSHIRNAFPNAANEYRNPTVDEITKKPIPYLEATIEEIHRCAQIFSMIFRQAQVDTTVLGYHIPKGTDVGMCTLGPSYDSAPFEIPDSHRSETSLAAKYQVGSFHLDDAMAFKPERWLKVDEKGVEYFDGNAGPLLGFGLGPRGCFGRRLAYLQMRIFLVLVLWNLELLEVEGKLASFKAVQKVSRLPVYCYLRLREVAR